MKTDQEATGATATTLTEAGTIQAQPLGSHRYRARLIEGDRWGSSGYYDREVLERDGPNVWPAGTPIYLDHPSLSEQRDRPERSVRDLAGKITSTPIYEGDGLYADVEFYPHTAPIIEALWSDVGMSIRAAGTAESGERLGRQGPVITSLSEGLSVDVVTRAGAGGKLVAMLESARANVEIVEAPAVEAAHEPPSSPAGSITETRKEPNVAQIQIDEAEHKRLTTEAAKVATIEAERAAAIARAEKAETAVAEAHKATDDAHVQRVIESAGVEFSRLELAGLRADMPVTEAGRLDVAAFETAVREAAAEVKERAGYGRPSGVGTVTESDYDRAAFERDLGITKEA